MTSPPIRLDPAIFAAALTWESYLAEMAANRQLLLGKLAGFRLPPAERAFWQGYDEALNVLVFTEDWCQDSVTALPPLLAVAAAAPTLTLRVLRRSEAAELERALLKDEYPPIPVFFFFDAAFTELGRFVEKPEGWQAMMADPDQRAWLRSDPEMYDALWAEMELRQLREIVSHLE